MWLVSFMNVAYFAKDVLSSPMNARAAPLTAVFLQPKRSVNMLTTGEQKKIIPIARAPTQAAGGERRRENRHDHGEFRQGKITTLQHDHVWRERPHPNVISQHSFSSSITYSWEFMFTTAFDQTTALSWQNRIRHVFFWSKNKYSGESSLLSHHTHIIFLPSLKGMWLERSKWLHCSKVERCVMK